MVGIHRKGRLLASCIGVVVLSAVFITYFATNDGNDITTKYPQDLRIGYINLHSAQPTSKELKLMSKYDCDLWLFLEWNGDNFDNHQAFLKPYSSSWQVKSDQTYGVLVLSKTTTIKVSNISNQSYSCNYPLHLIEYKASRPIIIYLGHAPPPVPKCSFQTNSYIENLATLVAKSKNKNKSIIIGDFNSLPFQNAFQGILDLGYQDSHDAITDSRTGTFSPFSWFPKIFKIDYMFNTDGFNPRGIYHFELSSSDHKGWIADFPL